MPTPPPGDGLHQLEELYRRAVVPFVDHLSGYRLLTDLDPLDSRPLRLDEATKLFVPVETWEQVLCRSGIATDDPRKREAMRVCWVPLRRMDEHPDVARRNRLAIYLRRDGSWLMWLERGIEAHSGTCIREEQILKVASPRQLQLPDGYAPYDNPGNEHLTDYAARTIRSVLTHTLSTTISRRNNAVASMRHVQYALGV